MYLTNHKAAESADRQYGRRIETDRSWTVYHVFTGVPAEPDAGATTGLNRAEATARMASLNRRDELRTASSVSDFAASMLRRHQVGRAT